MSAQSSKQKIPLKLESSGGKPLSFTLDDDGELVVGINDERDGSYTDFILTVPDLQKLREWLGSVPETPAPPVRGQHCTCAYYREDGFTIESGSPCSIHPNGCEHGRDWKTPCTECHRTLWGEPPPEQVKTTLNQESDRG